MVNIYVNTHRRIVISMDRLSSFSLIIMASLMLASAGVSADEPGELTVFCAASLTGAFGELGSMYENASGEHVIFNFDGSQALRTRSRMGLLQTSSYLPT